MDTVIVKGESVEEAIANALKALKADENDVQVQVVDWGEPGVLGIGGRPAAVKVAINHGNKPDRPRQNSYDASKMQPQACRRAVFC